MARPKKEQTSSTNLTDLELPVYTHKAIGIHKDSKSGEWVISELQYNPLTGEVSPDIKIESNSVGTRSGAIEAFKIAVVNKGIIG